MGKVLEIAHDPCIFKETLSFRTQNRGMHSNSKLAALYLDALAANQGLAVGTIATYRDDLRCYLTFLSDRSMGLSHVDIETVRDYLASLARRGFAESTIARRRSVVRNLHRFLVVEKIAESDPASLMEPARKRRTVPRIPSQDAVSRLLDGANMRARDNSLGLYRQAGFARSAALLEILYASGMRVSEAVTLPADCLRNRQSFHVRGKGGKERIVLVHERSVEAVDQWRGLAKAYGSLSDKWLFHSVKSGSRPLTRQAALLDIKLAGEAVGINPAFLSPHKLRHAFATHLLSNGIDLRTLQELLGHADMGSTEVYTHVDQSRTFRMVGDLHPLSEKS
jgi:integrase/recombinase XerD